MSGNRGHRLRHGPSATVRAAVYVRVSTQDQALEGTSLGEQEARGEQYIVGRGWAFAGVYADPGVSGGVLARPGLDRLRAACRAEAVDVVVVQRFDRLGRSARHFHALLGELDDLGVQVVSISEDFDMTSSAGRAMRNVASAFAEMERDAIRERTSRGLRRTAELGFWPGGPPPYGFRIVAGDHGHKRLSEEPGEAEVLRMAILAITEQGMTTLQAARALNDAGMLPRRSSRWTHQNLRRLLLESPLSGSWEYRRRTQASQRDGGIVMVSIPCIITPETHRTLLNLLKSTSTMHSTHATYLLSGRLVGPCGGRFYGVRRSDRGSHRYCCVNGRFDAEARCACRRVATPVVDEAVWAEVCALLSDSERLMVMASEYLGRDAEDDRRAAKEVATIEMRIGRLQKALTETLVSGARRGLDQDAVEAAAQKVQRDLDNLRRRGHLLEGWLAETRTKEEQVTSLKRMASRARRRLVSADTSLRGEILRLLDVKVVITGWALCAACKGRGKVRGGSGGLSCSSCSGGRYLPALAISGVVWEGLLDAASSHGQPAGLAIPFEITAAS